MHQVSQCHVSRSLLTRCSEALLRPGTRYWVMVAAPLIILGLVVAVLEAELGDLWGYWGYVAKAIALFAIFVFLNIFAYVIFDERWRYVSINSLLPLGRYINMDPYPT